MRPRLLRSLLLLATPVVLSAAGATADAGYVIETFQYGPSNETHFEAINNAGQVAGHGVVQGAFNGFIRETSGELALFRPGPIPLTSDINEAGQVVGRYDQGSQTFSFLREASGAITPLSAGAGSTVVAAINDAGVAAGDYQAPGQSRGGFVRDASGNYTIFGIPGGSAVDVRDLNNTGQVAGIYSPSGLQEFHGFVRNASGAITRLDLPGITSTGIVAINDSGTVFGNYFSPERTFRGFIYDPSGVYTTFEIAEATAVTILGANNLGDIVGVYRTTTGEEHGFVRSSSGDVTNIDPLGNQGILNLSINDNGVIAGTYSLSGGRNYGFIATPTAVPEPAGLVTLGIGLTGVAGYATRCRRRATVSHEAGATLAGDGGVKG